MEAGSVLSEDKGFAVRPSRQVGAWRDNLRFGSGRLGSRYPVVADRVIIGRMHGLLSNSGVPTSMWRRCRRTQGRTKTTGECPSFQAVADLPATRRAARQG